MPVLDSFDVGKIYDLDAALAFAKFSVDQWKTVAKIVGDEDPADINVIATVPGDACRQILSKMQPPFLFMADVQLFLLVGAIRKKLGTPVSAYGVKPETAVLEAAASEVVALEAAAA